MRQATTEDLAAIVELVEDGAAIAPAIADMLRRGFTYVLPFADGELAAAAHVAIDGERCRLELLVVAADAETEVVKQRMIGVAEALSAAHGCTALNVH